MKYPLILLITFLSITATSQEIVVADLETKQGIPFAIIENLNEQKSFYTDSEGKFSSKNNDSLKISCLGYSPKKILISKTIDSIFLQKKEISLNEVIINSKPKEVIELGFHNSKKKSFRFSMISKNVYPEVLIENDLKNKAIVEKVYLKVRSENDAYVRLHLYSFNISEEKIIKELLLENIVLNVDNSRKTKEIDISEYHIKMPNEGLIIVIELIKNTESITIGIGKAKKHKHQKTYFVRPDLNKKPVSIEMGKENQLKYMFGISVKTDK